MYIPKKKYWNSLVDFKTHLEKETSEKVVSFNGYSLVTETTVYGIVSGELICEVKPDEPRASKRRSDGAAADKKRVGAHGSSDHAEPDRKKAREVCAAPVPEKVPRRKKSPK